MARSNQKKSKKSQRRNSAHGHSTPRYRNKVLHDKLDEVIEACEKSDTLSSMVVVTLVLLRELGLMIIAKALEVRDEELHAGLGPQYCPHCGRLVRKPRRKKTSRRTLLGPVEWRRRVWQCERCHKQFAPVDWAVGAVGLQEKFSLEFIRELVLECTLHSFERACELFERHWGQKVSTHLAYALTMRMGEVLEKWQRAEAERVWQLRLSEPEVFEPEQVERQRTVYVMLDDSKLRIQEGKRGRGAGKRSKARVWQEPYNLAHHGRLALRDTEADSGERGEGDWRAVRAVLVFWDRDLAEVSKGRRQLLSRRVGAMVGERQQWVKYLNLIFHQEGVYKANRVVVVADGAKGLWNLVEELLVETKGRQVIQILDWAHMASRLWRVAEVMYPGDTKKARRARRRWVEPLLEQLAKGNTTKLRRKIQRLGRGRSNNDKLVHERDLCLDYIRDNAARIRYHEFRRMGLVIGSGAIESVHKWVIQARLKQAGMAWSSKGANIMLALRCLWASGHWDRFFANAPQPKHPPSVPLAISCVT